jgi:PKD repeat protein
LKGRSDTNHLYNLPPGVDEKFYTIMLVAEDSNKCNIRDTAYKTIKISTNIATLDFNAVKIPPCTNLEYQFTNLSVAKIGSFDKKGFLWDFGDGTKDTGSISYNPRHTFPSTGTYKVRLCVVDTFVCNSPDCIEKTIRVNPTVKAIFTTPNRGCVPYTPVFKNTSLGGISWLWDFGDGTTSTDFEPVHEYKTVGSFPVRLIAYDVCVFYCNGLP